MIAEVSAALIYGTGPFVFLGASTDNSCPGE